MIPELHRPIPIERVGSTGLDVSVEASATECAALARRMSVPAILSLSCHFHLERKTADTLLTLGHLTARLVQTCVISLDDFATTIEERFSVCCVPQGRESDDADPQAPDELPYEGGLLDLGEVAAEQLALALDPYPRAPGAVLPDIPDGQDAHPLAALATLRHRH